jgi:glutamyl-tRNA reductase
MMRMVMIQLCLLALALHAALAYGLKIGLSRNTFIQGAGAAVVGAAIAPLRTPAAEAPVAVVGAGGKTGKECVKNLLARGTPCRAVTRSGAAIEGLEGAELLAADVTAAESLASAVRGAQAVIFASSASKGGGKPVDVDYKGLVNVAKACLENDVPR